MKKNLIPSLIIIALIFPILLSGCSSDSSSLAPEPMTQPIITDDILPSGQSGKPADSAESSSVSSTESENQPSKETVPPASSEAASQSASVSGHSSHSSGHNSNGSSTSPGTSATQAPTVSNPTAAANSSPSQSAHDGEQITDYYRIKAELDALDIDKDNLEAAYRIGKLDEAAFRSQKSQLEAEEERLDDAKDLAEGTRHSHGEHTTYEGAKEELIVRLYAAKQKDDEIEEAIEQLEEDYRTGSIAREDFISQQARLLFDEDIVDQEKDSLEHTLEQMGWDD